MREHAEDVAEVLLGANSAREVPQLSGAEARVRDMQPRAWASRSSADTMHHGPVPVELTGRSIREEARNNGKDATTTNTTTTTNDNNQPDGEV